MSQPSTFHHFSQLPTELQIAIFKLAAEPDDREVNLQTTRAIFGANTVWLNAPYRLTHVFSTYLNHLSTHPTIYKTRGNLLKVCRLARRAALEVWRDDVRVLDVGRRFLLSSRAPVREQGRLAENDRRQMLEALERFIREVCDRLEGGH